MDRKKKLKIERDKKKEREIERQRQKDVNTKKHNGRKKGKNRKCDIKVDNSLV